MNMFLNCNIENVSIEKDGLKLDYTNRPININFIKSFGKFTSNPRLRDSSGKLTDTRIKVPSIKFSMNSKDSQEWFFNNEEERDNMYDNLIDATRYVI